MNKVAPKLGNIAARLRSVTKIHDLDARFREMDEFGDYRQVISLPKSDSGLLLLRLMAQGRRDEVYLRALLVGGELLSATR